MTLLILFAFLAIGVSFICSVLEAAILSVTPSYIAQLKESRPKTHKQLRKLKDGIDKPLAAILTLNTVALYRWCCRCRCAGRCCVWRWLLGRCVCSYDVTHPHFVRNYSENHWG